MFVVTGSTSKWIYGAYPSNGLNPFFVAVGIIGAEQIQSLWLRVDFKGVFVSEDKKSEKIKVNSGWLDKKRGVILSLYRYVYVSIWFMLPMFFRRVNSQTDYFWNLQCSIGVGVLVALIIAEDAVVQRAPTAAELCVEKRGRTWTIRIIAAQSVSSGFRVFKILRWLQFDMNIINRLLFACQSLIKETIQCSRILNWLVKQNIACIVSTFSSLALSDRSSHGCGFEQKAIVRHTRWFWIRNWLHGHNPLWLRLIYRKINKQISTDFFKKKKKKEKKNM